MKAAALLGMLLAAIASHAFGSTSTSATLRTGEFVLRNTDGTIPAPFTKDTNRFATDTLCRDAGEAAVKAGTMKPGTYKCDRSDALTITMTSTCADEPAPRVYLELVLLPDGNGAKGYDLPEMEPPKLKDGSDSEYMPERQWLYVHGPAWPAGYPNCWVRGWEDPALWRANPKAEPGKMFLERVEPGMTADDVELPNVEEPVEWPPELVAKWDASCDERHEAHVYYPEDTCA